MIDASILTRPNRHTTDSFKSGERNCCAMAAPSSGLRRPGLPLTLLVLFFPLARPVSVLLSAATPCSGRKRKLPPARSMPSRWYTLLALPFPDQQVGRREFTSKYHSRAGYFSNPL